MIPSEYTPEAALALLLSSSAMFLWSALLGRAISYRRFRGTDLVMFLVGLLASVGSFASAWAFAMTVEGFEAVPDLDPLVLTFVASVGRGALLMGGLILLLIGRRRPCR